MQLGRFALKQYFFFKKYIFYFQNVNERLSKNLMITMLFKTLKMFNANAETLSFLIVCLCIMYYVA